MYYNGMTGVFQLKLSSCKRCQIGITYRLLQLKGISATTSYIPMLFLRQRTILNIR